ncbi:hypothetical protein [Ruminococcus sp. RTP21484sp1_RTP31023st1_H8_RTP31023_210422]
MQIAGMIFQTRSNPLCTCW